MIFNSANPWNSATLNFPASSGHILKEGMCPARGYYGSSPLDDDRVVIGSQALSVALDICRGRVERMERNLIERLPFLKDVFVFIDDPLSAEALIEPPVEIPATNMLSTVVIAPHTDPSVFSEKITKSNLADVVPENATLGSEGGEKIDASARGDLTFSQLDDEARDAVL
ncbi:hypothetical protein Tco_1144702 [Tanacetum coccineum]